MTVNTFHMFCSNVGEGCMLGPFQVIPNSPNEQATEFTDQQHNLTSCSLEKTLAKYPDKVTVEELKWLDESYVDLKFKSKALHFKVRTSTMAVFVFNV